jgi:hypothetical protein
MESQKNYCTECESILRGRIDKKFCSDACRTLYHNRKNSQFSDALRLIDKRLKANRKILMRLYHAIPSDAKMVPVKHVENLGFTFNFYTHIDMDSDKEIIFCYEYGYQKVDDKKVQLLKQLPFGEGVELIA